jgi:hypothetical protein
LFGGGSKKPGFATHPIKNNREAAVFIVKLPVVEDVGSRGFAF